MTTLRRGLLQVSLNNLTFSTFPNFHPRSLKAYEREIAAARVELAGLRARIAERALALVGAPSVLYSHPDLGMCPQTGFDCSGLVSFLLDGVGFPRGACRHANEFMRRIPSVDPDIEEALPGDLVFFSRTGDRPTHVGVMAGRDEYVHAPGTGKPTADGTPETVVRSRLVIAPIVSPLGQPTLYRRNPIGIRRLAREIGTWDVW